MQLMVTPHDDSWEAPLQPSRGGWVIQAKCGAPAHSDRPASWQSYRHKREQRGGVSLHSKITTISQQTKLRCSYVAKTLWFGCDNVVKWRCDNVNLWCPRKVATTLWSDVVSQPFYNLSGLYMTFLQPFKIMETIPCKPNWYQSNYKEYIKNSFSLRTSFS